MTKPHRLLDDPGELSEDELRALSRAAQAEPPGELQAQVWASLAARLPMPVGSNSANAPSAAPASTTLAKVALISKVTLLVLALGGAAWLGIALLRVEPPRPPALAIVPSAVASSPPLEDVAPGVLTPSHEAKQTSAAPRRRPRPAASASSASSASSAPVAPSASNTQEESRLITAARSALRAGDSARALALLGEAQQRFGHGVLAQEREALTIEALTKSGQRASAKTRGEAFLKSYRDSPYAARIRTIIDGS